MSDTPIISLDRFRATRDMAKLEEFFQSAGDGELRIRISSDLAEMVRASADAAPPEPPHHPKPPTPTE